MPLMPHSVQIVLCVAALAVVLLPAYLPLITSSLAVVTLLVCIGPALGAWLRRGHSAQRVDSAEAGPSLHAAALGDCV